MAELMAGFQERSGGREAWADQLAEKFISTRVSCPPVTHTVIGMAYGGDHAIEPFRRTLSIPLSYAQSVCRAVDALSLLPLSDSAASANTANALGMGSSIKPDLFDH